MAAEKLVWDVKLEFVFISVPFIEQIILTIEFCRQF